MVKSKTARQTKRRSAAETDSHYLLKMIAYLIVGAFWLRIVNGASEMPLPIGFVVGLLISRHERLQIDRKIEYAILLMSMFLGYWFVPGAVAVI